MPRYVQYVGKAHRRVITSDAWRSIRLRGEDAVWDAQNGFAVPLDRFTDEQIKQAIEPDPDLVITDEDFKPTFSPADMTPWELKQSIENPVDVVALLNATDTRSTNVSEGLVPGGNVRTDADGPVNTLNEDDHTGPERDE